MAAEADDYAVPARVIMTANRATVGGMMGNNSAGAHSIVYGKTVDHVMELDAVLAQSLPQGGDQLAVLRHG